MKVTLSDGNTYRIVFRHYRHTSGIAAPAKVFNYIEAGIERVEQRLGLRSFQLNAATECWLVDVLAPLPYDIRQADGYAGCSRHDEWDIEQARRVALGRAIQTVIPRHRKADREAVWNAYFSRGTQEVQDQLAARQVDLQGFTEVPS